MLISISDLNQSGKFNNIEWSVKYIGDERFKIKATNNINKKEMEIVYRAIFPIKRGVDMYDVHQMNKILNYMIVKGLL
jgi:hypothetical protein